MAKQNQQGGGAQASTAQPSAESRTIRVRFMVPWSSDLGYFAFGRVAELPAPIAASLIEERVAEESSEDLTE